MSFPIPELFAWVGRDPTGDVGLLSIPQGNDPKSGLLFVGPATFTRRRNAERLREVITLAATARGHPVHLVHYTADGAQILDTVEP